MDTAWIESEIRRLSPWYYRYQLGGIWTDITPPCDHHGHRTVTLPLSAVGELEGKRVLDVACNEGGYSFSAIEHGAGHVTGFDVRAINVEKARFVAKVRGHENADFHVSSCDTWIAEHPEQVDFVFLCGLLYHLTEPWRTVAEYGALAREGMFVTCVLNGGEDGYTPFPEQENIAASEDPSEMSMMPNTSRTIVKELVKNGFHPLLIGESCGEGFWGGCTIYARRLPRGRLVEVTADGTELYDLHVAPTQAGGFAVCAYNRTAAPRSVQGTIRVKGPAGELLEQIGPGPLEFPARVAAEADPPSTSVLFELPSTQGHPLDAPLTFEIEIAERGGAAPDAALSVRYEP